MNTRDILMPELGLNVPITVSAWLVARGAQVTVGEPVVEILAGPATVDLAAPTNGVLIEKAAGTDEPVAVGQRLGRVQETD